jgi:serine/threonine protein kinase
MTDEIVDLVIAWPHDRLPTAADLLPDRPDLHPQAAERLAKLDRFRELGRRVAGRPTDPHPVAEPDPLDPPLAAGDIGALGDGLRVLGVLGEGGMGVVYEAEATASHPGLRAGQRVAVKLLKTGGPAAAEYLREAKAAVAARHHHVVPVYEVGQFRGRPFLVMPRLSGETLEARLTRHPRCDLGFLLQVGRHTAAGLTAVHAAGYVHRDVKPANLWLEGWHDYLRVIDFGLARPTAGGPTGPSGTLGYMAPEQLAGEPADGRADLFGLGCVLYRMATTLPAFGGTSPPAVLRAMREHRPPAVERLRPDLPPDLCRLIHTMLAPDPADRPADVAVVRAALTDLYQTSQTRGAMPERHTTGWVEYVAAESGRYALVAV